MSGPLMPALCFVIRIAVARNNIIKIIPGLRHVRKIVFFFVELFFMIKFNNNANHPERGEMIKPGGFNPSKIDRKIHAP